MAASKIRSIIATVGSGTPAYQIIRALGQQGAMTSAQLARFTGLARSTVSSAVSELRNQQVVVETIGAAASGVGRPGTTLSLNPAAGTCLGIHIGFSDVQVVLADLAHSFIAEQKIELGIDYGPDEALTAIQAVTHRFFRNHRLSEANLIGVGVSVSGPVRPDGVVMRGGILPRWSGRNVRSMFASLFDRPVLTDNESNCAAIAEMKWGIARGETDFVIFKMDLGVGGAIVSNGRLVTGVSGGAGEFGHVSLDPEGALCRCGNRGCLELYASFQRPIDELSRVHKRAIGIDEAITLAQAGDAGAQRLIADAADYGGRGLAMVGNILNPPLIIIGGRLARAGELLLAPMRSAFRRHSLIKQDPEDAGGTQIRTGTFTENDSLLGAVGLVLDQHDAMARAVLH